MNSSGVRDRLHFAGSHVVYARVAWLVSLVFAALLASLLITYEATAVTTVPTKMNFQGRLTDSAGNVKADGTYNMRLRLYTVSSGGSAVWSEDRLVSASQGVTVTNGLFSIQLGSVTTLPASLFASGDLYLSVELPSVATATSSSPSWTEGAMTPRNQLATSAYAYNTETLDGLDSADFGQLTANNSWSGTQSFTGSTFSISGSTNAAKFNVGSIFNVDTANSVVSIGASDTTGTVLVLDTKTDSGDPSGTNGAIYYNSNLGKFRCYQGGAWTDCIGSGTDNISMSSNGIILSGNARTTRTATLIPEFSGATFTGDGSNNNGSLSSDFCSGSSRLSINTSYCGATEDRNYYQWTTTQASAQDYDIYVRFRMPSDYSSGSMTNLTATAWGTSTATESAVLTLYSPGSSTPCTTTSNLVTGDGAWDTSTVASPVSGCTLAANDIVTVRIHLVAGQNKFVRMGQFSFTYRGTF